MFTLLDCKIAFSLHSLKAENWLGVIRFNGSIDNMTGSMQEVMRPPPFQVQCDTILVFVAY